jgi:hemoglobin
LIWISGALLVWFHIEDDTSFGMAPCMNETNSGSSPYERIGGAAAIAGMVDRFYSRVLADPKLKAHFEHVETDKLLCMQREFFSAALGGPARYSGRSVIHAHQGRHITGDQFRAFAEHLFGTLKDFDLTDDERYAIIAWINTYADDVMSVGVGL